MYRLCGFSFLCLFVYAAIAFPVHQYHTNDYWVVRGDNAASAVGDVGWYWLFCWQDIPSSYNLFTVYDVNVTVPFTDYVGCQQGSNCTEGLSSPGEAKWGNLYYQKSFYPFNWYSFPLDGDCSVENLSLIHI
eukprot:TRINITY_DN22329_c0_g1_i1.p1 TRINITY_DN22329_c0_g1~~TRINITY_DN22329_c0_g1_i1.p1  ORF type:complete len:132 (-),score=17.50 TRINITY_DN22329_c0_g1_i1:26-421(-)